MRARLLFASTFAAAFLTGSACGPRTEGLDPSKIPDNVRADYELFATRCSKCHGLSRPLQAGITDDDQWVMYVRRMRRQQGSGISHEDEQIILRFLRWYAADLRRIQAEKRGAPPEGAAQATPPPAPAPTADGGAL